VTPEPRPPGGVFFAYRKLIAYPLEVPDGSTVRVAIELSGILKQFPEIDLDRQKVGIFGKLTKLNAPIEEDTRIEIYREITADPELVKRRDTWPGTSTGVVTRLPATRQWRHSAQPALH
jgi:uncharacterized protein